MTKLNVNNPGKLLPAIFLDRDGVLIEDVDWLSRPEQIRVLPGVPAALRRLAAAGYRLVVVTNQPIVARGLVTEPELEALHRAIAGQLAQGGGVLLDRFYYCPHHPKATLPAYRADCDCRKPRPGLLRRAAEELNLDPRASFMVGDRLTDVAAGASAGCRTILVETGKHLAPLIQTAEPMDPLLKADWICADLPAATEWILSQK